MSNHSNSKTLKFAISIMIFLVLLMIFVFLFVIPGIQKYKSTKSQYKYELEQKIKLSQNNATLENTYKALQKQHQLSLKSFSNDFNETEFLTFSKKYFENVKITPKRKNKSEDGLETYEFNAQFNAKTPVKFYNFVQGLNALKSIVKLNFPITLDAKNGMIVLKFNMSVYRLKNHK